MGFETPVSPPWSMRFGLADFLKVMPFLIAAFAPLGDDDEIERGAAGEGEGAVGAVAGIAEGDAGVGEGVGAEGDGDNIGDSWNSSFRGGGGCEGLLSADF